VECILEQFASDHGSDGLETGTIESLNLGYSVLKTLDNRRVVVELLRSLLHLMAEPAGHIGCGSGWTALRRE
jgi:hypothetical protein